MQKFIPITILMFISFNYSTAQNVWLQTGFSSASAKYEFQNRDQIDNEKFNPGFQAGILSELPLSRNIFIQPGIIFQTKGYFKCERIPEFQAHMDGGFNFWYLDIPVLLSTKIQVHKVNLFTGLGPYAGIGLSGTYRFSSDLGDGNPATVENDRFEWGKDENAVIKRMEYGIMGIAGTEINRFKFGFSYTYGLRNIFIPDDYVYKNRVLSLFISYAVLRDKKK